MAETGNSKEIQTSAGTYRFAEFELHPRERLLIRGGSAVALSPKAFDALLCLIRKAEHLVLKSELMDVLWPSTYVSEANLTNTIVSLRKVLGHEAMQTVSGHGYRFMLPVCGEPGIARKTYDSFVQARELIRERSVESITRARELLWLCLAEDPGFAPAWAWAGRCCWILAKLGGTGSDTVQLADAALQRAFAIDPDLACAHQFYTPVQADTGKALQALSRLIERLGRHPGEPETLTGLVQVLGFCGFLEQSVNAHDRAMALDPTLFTSVAHTHFLAADYAAAIDSYGGRAGYYLDAAAWAALGHADRACKLLRERLAGTPLSALMSCLMRSLLSIVEGRFDEASRCMQALEITREPEALVYIARHYSFMGESDAAIGILRRAVQSGFVCSPRTLRCDPWLAAVRRDPRFPSVLAESEHRTTEAQPLISSVPI